MSIVAATRYHDFSYGHRVVGHESKCALMHGHNGRVHFRCQAQLGSTRLDAVGRVIDFSVIKSTLCQWLEDNWDHKTLIFDQDPDMVMVKQLVECGLKKMLDASIVWVPFNPTAENMAHYLVEVVGPQLLKGTGVELVACEVSETRKCSATYFR